MARDRSDDQVARVFTCREIPGLRVALVFCFVGLRAEPGYLIDEFLVAAATVRALEGIDDEKLSRALRGTSERRLGLCDVFERADQRGRIAGKFYRARVGQVLALPREQYSNDATGEH